MRINKTFAETQKYLKSAWKEIRHRPIFMQTRVMASHVIELGLNTCVGLQTCYVCTPIVLKKKIIKIR